MRIKQYKFAGHGIKLDDIRIMGLLALKGDELSDDITDPSHDNIWFVAVLCGTTVRNTIGHGRPQTRQEKWGRPIVTNGSVFYNTIPSDCDIGVRLSSRHTKANRMNQENRTHLIRAISEYLNQFKQDSTRPADHQLSVARSLRLAL